MLIALNLDEVKCVAEKYGNFAHVNAMHKLLLQDKGWTGIYK